MEKIIITIAAVILGMGGMAGGSAVDSNSIVEDGIEYYIQTDKSVYDLGENVQMLYRVTNLSEDDVEFIFTFGPLDNTCDWMVDQDELRIWDNLGRPVTFVITSFTLNPSESYEYTHTWDMTYKNGDNILPGNYNVTAVLGYPLSQERYVPLSVQIEIIPEPAMIYYVDVDARGANDGSSWADAYNYLQDALAAASSGDEIRVAQGIYRPDRSGAPPPVPPPTPPPSPPPLAPTGWNNNWSDEVTLGDRTATFQLINGVAIKGGYAGFSQPDPNARDIELYETILSGDLDGNDIDMVDINHPWDLLSEPTRSENSYHVVTGSGTDEMTVLDGFTIAGGNANYYSRYPPNAYSCGGGMYTDSGGATVINCTFGGNTARMLGGGMYNSSSELMIVNCTFEANRAKEGGGMESRTSVLTLIDCTFSDNAAAFIDGGMGIRDSNAMLTDCTFSGNIGGYSVGGLGSINSNVTLTNCRFTGNWTPWPSPLIMGGGGAGGLAIGGGKAILTDCIFSGNSATGGGGMTSRNADLTLTNCIFSGNSAYSFGGGMFDSLGSIPATLTNCTFSGNSARYEGGGICHSEYGSSATLTNCILWGNTAARGPQLKLEQNSSLDISFSCIEGGQAGIYDPYQGLVWGPGNIDADPCFVQPGYWDTNSTPPPSPPSPPGPPPGPPLAPLSLPPCSWVDGDYHLLGDSPCIDAGDPNYVAEPNETDLDGKPRVIGGRIDMGAYEYSPALPAEVRIVPRTINLASEGNWITCYIWLGEDYDVAAIDPNSVVLEDEIEHEWIWLDEQQEVAMARFSRSEVQGGLNIGDVELTITGQLTDGTVFEGTDVIRVIDKGRKSAK